MLKASTEKVNFSSWEAVATPKPKAMATSGLERPVKHQEQREREREGTEGTQNETQERCVAMRCNILTSQRERDSELFPKMSILGCTRTKYCHDVPWRDVPLGQLKVWSDREVYVYVHRQRSFAFLASQLPMLCALCCKLDGFALPCTENCKILRFGCVFNLKLWRASEASTSL